MKRFENKKGFALMFNKNNIKAYLNAQDDVLIVTDNNDNILFEVNADCGQNSGFMKFID